MKKRYVYEGPVTIFNKCVTNRWKASTYAESAEKARSNLSYRYKQMNNLTANSRVELPGKLVMVDETMSNPA